ncbi:MAG: monofunctional biosynthetic peptidoglycan transglycosylase [Muribaculaceae bacterium]|jgi:monofunctional biosynthetic peptidoglycan transglycosylase|nr:monofunctional biosynthetic peptidoglycan transglycosylase [Muribaculaceae bacterium]MBQ2236153.1 monofunctional biosynthetic peptidoglycan transglycosylase [Muribaculaceae bacterium]MBQ2485273.1 monofunctional biosynthetic peptidoglycan transglycosylase [Muribaculaceae bacterium]MBQ4005665.1 monofunctional biosynthetic peptidoglycan transglycosylase [Muribaculaceae bacterium]
MIKRLLRTLRNILLFLVFSSILAVVAYRWVPVYVTPLMVSRSCSMVFHGDWPHCSHTWVPLDSMSVYVPQAVMASEDNLFLQHNGFDFEQIYKARLEAMRGGRERGASTITQQTAKNVFLWHGRSYVRKGLEAYFTVLIEWVWGKERIMEVYLNSIEMGDGIYGVEAVAQEHFGKHAKRLTKREAALIAASLPNPLKRDSGNPTPAMNRRSRAIMDLMGKIESFDAYRQAKNKGDEDNTAKTKKKNKRKP